MAVSQSNLVAPDMGSAENGVKKFKGIKPPYARGGGTPATEDLEAACLQHIAKWDPSSGTDAPFVSIVSSGQAANHVVFRALQGGDMVCSKHLFGTTKVDLRMTFGRAGGQIAWVDPCDTQAFIDSTTDRTTAWFAEAISNPAGRVPDLAELRKAAGERGIALILDTTLAAGMPAFKGLEYADILTVSLTKQAGGGQNQNVGGAVIVDSDFPWAERADRFPELRAYFADAHGQLTLPSNPMGALVSKISLHEGSGVIAPHTARSITRLLPGMESRVATQCYNARMLADVLKDHPQVGSIQLAGTSTDKGNDLRTYQFFGSNHFVLLVDLKGGAEAAEHFINSNSFLHAVALGQRTTAVSHPASSTHRQYSKDDLAAMGIYDGTIRISVGTERLKVLKERMQAALAACEPGPNL